MSDLAERSPIDVPDGAGTGLLTPAAVLNHYNVLDTSPEPAFDRVTALAAHLFDAPIAIISFFDQNRLWFKSHHGLDATNISWAPDTSASAMEQRIRSEFDVRFFVGVPLRTPDGHDVGTLCVINHIFSAADARKVHQLEKLGDIVIDLLEQRLARQLALAQATLMGNEVDHRTMNSLQFVASLLHLQSSAVGPEAAAQLMTASNRVHAVARVHRSFSVAAGADHVPMLTFLRRLCDELSTILDTAITIEGVEARIPTTQIMAIGLIVNELATNAKKHGDGAIDVTFNPRPDGQYELCVLDRGPGLPKTFSIKQPAKAGLGIKVVVSLARQLDGTFSASGNPAGRGACFKVVFPVPGMTEQVAQASAASD